MKFTRLLAIVGPGILVAATGVGAGDLATGAFTGQRLGVAILWAVIVGAVLKYVLNEGLTRWQLATGQTLLEGCMRQLGRPFQIGFLIYLLLWSYFLGGALMSACGATMHAMFPLMSANNDKILYGILHSVVAVALVRIGGYRLFEKVMTVCIGVMFFVVVTTAVALLPSADQVLKGIFIPVIPQVNNEGVEWTVALLGGVGGTLTILCYGYWIREEGRMGPETLKVCRIDLATGYVMTALFGMAMVVIGSRLAAIEGGGAALLVNLADGLIEPFGAFGPAVRWAFLLGAWGAVFSSLLGVWQSVPYLFTDFCNMSLRRPDEIRPTDVNIHSRAYRFSLYGLATIPAAGLWLTTFQAAQKIYALIGALIIPILAGLLLYLNNRVDLIGPENRNKRLTNVVLWLTLAFFVYAGWLGIREKL